MYVCVFIYTYKYKVHTNYVNTFILDAVNRFDSTK